MLNCFHSGQEFWEKMPANVKTEKHSKMLTYFGAI